MPIPLPSCRTDGSCNPSKDRIRKPSEAMESGTGKRIVRTSCKSSSSLIGIGKWRSTLVNGQDVGWFLLDSGAGAMVIDKALADSLHLERLNRGSALGVGGTFESSARAVDKFEIGPMTLRNVRFGDYDFSSFNTGSGPRIAGTVGTPIFRRAVVVMNWTGPTVENTAADSRERICNR